MSRNGPPIHNKKGYTMAARKTEAQVLEDLRAKLAAAEAKQAEKIKTQGVKLNVDVYRLDRQIAEANESFEAKVGELTKAHEEKVAKLTERRKAAYDTLLASGVELKEPTPEEIAAHTPKPKPKTEKPEAEQPKPTESKAEESEVKQPTKPAAKATAVSGKGQ